MSDKQQTLVVVEEPKEWAVQVQTTYEMFRELLKDPGIDPARIGQLMELHRQAEKWEAEKQFTAAFNRLQDRLPRISKRGRIEFESKRTGAAQSTAFAKYEDIWAAVKPLMSAEGFTIGFGTEAQASGILIKGTLSHIGGYSKTDSLPLPFDTSGSKNAIQAVGSTVTFGKRYLLCAMLNIITVGEDDDGNALSFLDLQQVNVLLDLQQACEMDPKSCAKFLEVMNVKQLEDIHKRDYAKATNLLNAKLRKLQDERNK